MLVVVVVFVRQAEDVFDSKQEKLADDPALLADDDAGVHE